MFEEGGENVEIFRLFGSVLIDDNEARNSLSRMDGQADDVGGKFGKMIGTAAKWGAALAAGAAAAGAGVFALASKISDTASEINDMSVRTGLSTKTLQEMKFATGQVGVNFESITGAVGRLTKTMGDAGEGTEAAQLAFDKLGISTVDSEGNMRKMDEMFPEVIKSLAGMENETERNALAMDLFGKGALELAPLLSAGGEGIDAFAKQANDLGLVLSEDAISAGDQFGDSLDAIKATIGGVVAGIGVDLMPTFQSMMDWVMAHIPEIKETISDSIDTAKAVFDKFGDAIQFVKDNADILIPVIVGLTGAIAAQAIIGTITKLMDAWKLATATQTTMQWLLNAALNANPLGVVALAIGAVIAVGVLLWKNWDTVKVKAGELWDNMKIVFGNIESFVTGVWDGVVSTIMGAVNKIKGAIDSVLGAYNKAKDAVGGFVSGAKDKISNFASKIPGFADGTDFAPGGIALVGERGPELVNLPRGSQVTPNDRTEKMLGSIGTTITGPIHITVQADDLKQMSDVISLFNQLPQAARAGG